MRGQRRVALCMGLDDFYDHGIARGVVRYAREKGAWKLFGYGWMFHPLKDISSWKGDGVVARVEFRRDAARLAALGVPVVDVAGAVTEAGFLQVNNDDTETGRLAGEHLRACGFRRFAYCGVREVGWSARRKAGFAGAIRPVCGAFSVFEQTLPWWETPEVPRDFAAWVKSLPVPCGVMACNDTAGLKLTAACRDLGLQVPRDVAVIGVDDEDVVCELSSPSLSSIPCDCERIGYEAAAALDRLMEGRRVRGPVFVPPRPPVIRASSDTVACVDPLVAQAVRFIREQAGRRLGVRDILARVPASRRTLEVRFRRELGTTMHAEIVRARIDRAKRLLGETDMPVKAVAAACGFGTPQRFHSVFRAETGAAPIAWRRRARGPRR